LRVSRRRHLRTIMLVLVVLGSVGIALAAYATRVLRALEGSTVDARFSIRGALPPPRNLALVYVDERTFTELRLQWPFARAVEGQVIRRIAAAGPAAIAYDIEFPDPSQFGRRDDVALLEAITSARGRIAFSTAETGARGNVPFLGSGEGTALLHSVGAQPADAQFPLDSGGVVRHMRYAIGGLPTLAVVTAELATGRRVPASLFGAHEQWIDYYGPAGSFPSVSFSDVYRGRIPAAVFRGKIVVVGASDPALQAVADFHATSTSSNMSGPGVQANAIESVLHGLPLRSLTGWLDVAVILLMGAAVPVASMRLAPALVCGGTVALGFAFAIAAQLLFDAGRVVVVTYPLLALALSAVGALAVQWVTEAIERLWVRDLFARFVPENVVDEVLARADGLRLGGVQREGTVMFTDLRGFTTFAESLAPEQVIDVLNHYLSEMSDAILDHGGTLVAYMGDGIMAVFGAPLEQSDHADRALATAREMLTTRLPRFNAWLREHGLSDGFRMGIGLNSGQVMSGNVGSERRVEYTAVGDTTNSAARIEQLTKGTPHQLMLSDATRGALHEQPADLLFVDELELRGRTARMRIWGLGENGAGPS